MLDALAVHTSVSQVQRPAQNLAEESVTTLALPLQTAIYCSDTPSSQSLPILILVISICRRIRFSAFLADTQVINNVHMSVNAPRNYHQPLTPGTAHFAGEARRPLKRPQLQGAVLQPGRPGEGTPPSGAQPPVAALVKQPQPLAWVAAGWGTPEQD